MIEKLFNLPSILRVRLSPLYNRWYFKRMGVRFGSNMMVIGKVPIIGPGKITIGDNFIMTSGEHVSAIISNLQGSLFTSSADATITINVGMSSTRIWVHNRLAIGNNVKVGGDVLIIDTDSHELNYMVRNGSSPSGNVWGETIKSSPIVIEDDVWIGAQCIVLKGVTIGARTIIGAGSVVAKSIPADCIAAGNPCRIIKKINQNN